MTERGYVVVAIAPLVDTAVVDQLVREVGCRGARRFVERYRSALGNRLAQLCDHVGRDDPDAAYDVVLNLASSSAMAGASRLAAASRDLAARLRESQVPSRMELEAFGRLVRQTDVELVGVLQCRPGLAPSAQPAQVRGTRTSLRVDRRQRRSTWG